MAATNSAPNLPAAGNNHRAAWGLLGGGLFLLLARNLTLGGKGNLTLASHAVGDISNDAKY
jgi:hypothetical protein